MIPREEPLDLGPFDPGEHQVWATNAEVEELRRMREQSIADFERRLAEGMRRYDTSPEFHARVNVAARAALHMDVTSALRIVVALEMFDTSDQIIEAAAKAISWETDHPELGQVDWPDIFDAREIVKATLRAMGMQVDATPQDPVG